MFYDIVDPIYKTASDLALQVINTGLIGVRTTREYRPGGFLIYTMYIYSEKTPPVRNGSQHACPLRIHHHLNHYQTGSLWSCWATVKNLLFTGGWSTVSMLGNDNPDNKVNLNMARESQRIGMSIGHTCLSFSIHSLVVSLETEQGLLCAFQRRKPSNHCLRLTLKTLTSATSCSACVLVSSRAAAPPGGTSRRRPTPTEACTLQIRLTMNVCWIFSQEGSPAPKLHRMSTMPPGMHSLSSFRWQWSIYSWIVLTFRTSARSIRNIFGKVNSQNIIWYRYSFLLPEWTAVLCVCHVDVLCPNNNNNNNNQDNVYSAVIMT